MLAAFLIVSVGNAAPEMAPWTTIPGGRLRIGTDMEGVFRAAEECNKRQRTRELAVCAPENFMHELGRGTVHEVKEFLIGRREVSVAEYERCVHAGRCSPVRDARRIEAFRKPGVPMVFVTQREAASYCKFIDARLPTEAEFELAARGSKGRRYPWGNLYHHGRANAGRAGARVTDRRDGYELLAPASSFLDGMTSQGVLNLAGNAAEWTSSQYAPHGDAEAAAQSSTLVVKGGSFAVSPVNLRASARRSAGSATREADIGFRCARSRLRSEAPSPKASDSR